MGDTAGGDARYRVTFQATWSAETHPTNFPANPHFSGLVGATHNENNRIWQRGKLASDGIELMAETGGKTQLLPEIAERDRSRERSRRALRRRLVHLSGKRQPGVRHRGVTSVRDAGEHGGAEPRLVRRRLGNLSLLSEDGTWKEREEVMLRLYDAGTDDGTTFTAANADSDPAQPISRLSSESGDTDFTDGNSEVGTFLFEKLP